jgi:hypothetical protein
MKNIIFGLICVLGLTGCPQVPRLPQKVLVTIDNPQPSTGTCPDGVQVTLAKGANSWTSPLVTETRFGFGVSPPSSEYGYFFTGDTKVEVTVLCKKGAETGTLKAVWQTGGFIFGVSINTSKPHTSFPVDNLYVVSISQESLPLPQIYPQAY